MPRVKLFDEQEVLQSAMNLFWKNGYSATSIQDLVNHLGINRASLYDTYGGKKELFNRSFQYYRDSNMERLRVFFKQEESVKEGFRKFFNMAIEESLTDSDKKGCFVVNTITEIIPGDDEIKTILKNHEKIVEKIFYDFLKKGKANGEISEGKDLKAIAYLIFTFYNGLRVVTKVNTNSKKIMKSANMVLSLLD